MAAQLYYRNLWRHLHFGRTKVIYDILATVRMSVFSETVALMRKVV
jgi:hypothetical protein